jgi:hypothetical protein
MTHPRADLLRELAHIVDNIAARPTPDHADIANAIINHELALLQRETEQERRQ